MTKNEIEISRARKFPNGNLGTSGQPTTLVTKFPFSNAIYCDPDVSGLFRILKYK